MHSFEQYMPTKIVLGKEAELKAGTLAKEWQAKKVLLVYGGGSVVRSGLLGRVEAVWRREAESKNVPCERRREKSNQFGR